MNQPTCPVCGSPEIHPDGRKLMIHGCRIRFPKGWTAAMRDKWLLGRIGLRLRAESGLSKWKQCEPLPYAEPDMTVLAP